MQNETLKHDKEDKDPSTTHYKDLDLDTYNQKHKNICWKPERYLEWILNTNIS